MSEKQFCLTLDLENDWYFDEDGYDHLVLEHLDEFIGLIDELDVPLSVFVVGKTLEKYPESVNQIRTELDAEFHLHSYQHDTDKDYEFRTEIQRGKTAYRDHFGVDPNGYRAPQGNIDPAEFEILEDEGFMFDSSVFPSYRPGVYNNLQAPLEPYSPEEAERLLEIPIGVTPHTRIPLSHSYLKLLGRPYVSYLRRCSLPTPVVYNVHLQDLYRTDSHDRLPRAKQAIYDRNMSRSEELLQTVVEIARKRGYEFNYISKLCKECSLGDVEPVNPDLSEFVGPEDQGDDNTDKYTDTDPVPQ